LNLSPFAICALVGTGSASYAQNAADSGIPPGSIVASLSKTLQDSQLSSSAAVGLALSTPILFEGDSNTDWAYSVQGWPKIALADAGGRYYIPVGGDFATAGATVSGNPNGLVARQSETVAKITAEVASFGHCIMWFQIGTNGGTASVDIPALTSLVQAWKSAGAFVIANTCPNWNGSVGGYVDQINTAIKNGTIPVNRYLDVQPYLVQSGSVTHYDDDEKAAVGGAAGALLANLAVAGSIYTDSISGLVQDALTGTGGTAGNGSNGISGQLPDNWTSSRQTGNGTMVCSVVSSGVSGRRSIRLVATGGSQATNFKISKSESFSFNSGDVIDGWATVALVSTDDTIFKAMLRIGNAAFPATSTTTAFTPSTWNDAAGLVWRGYPINQASSGSTITKDFTLVVAAGKTVTFEVSGFCHVVRETSSGVAPQNTVAPVMGTAWEGGSPNCSNGTWTGTPTPTYSQQFYLDATPIASSYVFSASDVGHDVACYVTATNSAGQTQQQSDTTTVVAASYASLSTSLAPVTLSAAIIVLSPISADLSKTLGAATLSADASVTTGSPVTADLGVTLAPATLSADASVTAGNITADLSANLAAATLSADATMLGPIWDSSVNSSPTHMQYSLSNTRVGRDNTSTVFHARGLAPIASTDKKHWAVKIEGTLSSNFRVGVCDNTVGAGTGGTGGTNSAYYTATGGETYTGGTQSNQGNISNGNIVDIEVDRVNNVIRWAINGGSWTTDRSISGLTATNLYCYNSLGLVTDAQITLQPISAWLKSASSGFSAL
jgi:hypothetical protein